MSKKGSRRRRQQHNGKFASNGSLLMRPPPQPPRLAGPASTGAAIPLSHRQEPLVVPRPVQVQGHHDIDELAPLPRNRSLVDPNQPVLRRLRFWMLDLAERWVVRNRPLPEQPTIGQLNRLRSDLASVQRKLDRMLG